MKKHILLCEERSQPAVSVHIPTDVLNDLENIAHEKEVSSVEALIQFYIGQGLRRDIEIFGANMPRNTPKNFEECHAET